MSVHLPGGLCYFDVPMETISHLIMQYGYAGIFFLLLLGIVGLPIPDETLLTFAGYLVYKGRLLGAPAYACAAVGSMCGITISYILGRSLGLFLLHHYGRFLHISPGQLDRVHSWFDRFGTWTLLMGYFIPGIRHVTAIVAGTSKLRPALFATFAYAGAFIWSATFILIGYYFGEGWSRVLRKVHHHLMTSLWIFLVAAIIFLVWQFRKKMHRSAPSGTEFTPAEDDL